MDKAPLPENHWVKSESDDLDDTVIAILGQVNDTLAHYGKGVLFAAVPSQQNGMEIVHFTEKDKVLHYAAEAKPQGQ